MIVKELIEDLSKADPTADVTILDEGDNEKNITCVEVYKYSVLIVMD